MKTPPGIPEIIRSFSGLKVLVIGDVMTDSYLFGKVERISPEAPVPVVHITHREERPGGAANVAINLKSLGAVPIICSVTGDDDAGYDFISLLEKENIASDGMVRIPGRKTTVKTRVIGNSHQLLRVDDETVEDLVGNSATEFIRRCSGLMRSVKPDVIVFEDYDKGVLTREIIQATVKEANVLGIPVTVDPKRKNFNVYENITLFKPNLHELKSGLSIQIDTPDVSSMKKAVEVLLKNRSMKMVMVTLSEAGVFIATEKEACIIPAHIRNISDVSGAGDTVISVAALCTALSLPIELIAGLSNLAGGLVCEQVGVVPIDKNLLLDEAVKNPLYPALVKI